MQYEPYLAHKAYCLFLYKKVCNPLVAYNYFYIVYLNKICLKNNMRKLIRKENVLEDIFYWTW